MAILHLFHETAHQPAHLARVFEQLVFLVNAYGRETRGARERMAVVSQTAVEEVLLEVLGNLPSHSDRTQLHVSTRQSLRHRHQIRHYLPMVYRKPLAGAAKPSHHFVGNQHDSVLVTKLTQSLHVSIRRNHNSVCPDSRLDNSGGDGLSSFEFDRLFGTRQNFLGRVEPSLNTVVEIRNAKHAGN